MAVVNKKRYNISVSYDVLADIETFQKDQHYPYLSEATVELIKLGLSTVKQEKLKAFYREQVRDKLTVVK